MCNRFENWSKRMKTTICKPFRQICQGGNWSWELYIDQAKHVLKSELFSRRQVLDLLNFIDTWYEELGRSWSVLSASAFGLGARSCLNVFNWKYPWQNLWTKFSTSCRQESPLLHIFRREPKLTSIDVWQGFYPVWNTRNHYVKSLGLLPGMVFGPHRKSCSVPSSRYIDDSRDLLRNVSLAESQLTWARDQLETKNWSANTFKKYVTSMIWIPEPVIQSCDTGQWYLFWHLSIDNNMDGCALLS